MRARATYDPSSHRAVIAFELARARQLYRRAERAVQEAEVTRLQANEAANQTRAQAEAEAQRIREEAQRDADRLITEAQARHQELKEANLELRERMAAVESVLRSVDSPMAGASEIAGGGGSSS